MYEFNSCQTPLEELNIESLQREFREQYYEFLTSVPFIRNLTAKDRPRAKDLPRDEEGKIIVNLTKPHILEDMDYFRQTGLYFQQHGKYTELRPNNNPNSEYYKWFKEEVRRCWYGMVRPSDGEWIPGDLYFYWNYTEIQLADKSSNKKKSKKAVRRYGIPDVWDGTYFVAHYLYQAREAGEHFCMLSSRGKGKTLFGASLLTKRFKLGEDELTQKGVTCYITAADTKYLNKGNQILTAFQHNIDFLTKNTEFPNKSLLSRSLKDMNWVAGRKDLAIGDVGSGNTVVGITSNEDAEKLRGSRACLYIIEEGGTFSRLLDVWENSIPSVEQGQGEERSVFGILMVYGTSGDDESNFTDMAEIMYHPIGYGVKRVDNVFDLEGKAGNNFSWFFPSYLNNEGCYDKNGNSDVTRALKYILEAREQKKNDTTKINALAKYIAERPIVPQEAIRRVVGNLFPVVELNDRIAQLDNDKHAFDEVAVGSLELKPNGSVEFRMTNDAPIREYPIGTNKVKGAVEIYHMPEVDKLGKVTSGRYIVGHDPVDNDEAETLSLTSTFVLDLFTDNIVAEYTGRQDFADDNFEIVRRLCIFYNATCLYENNKRGLYAYFKKMRCTYMLADTPEYLRDKDLIKTIGIGNSSKGVNATKPINDYANKLIKDWLLLPKPIIEKDVNGQEVESTTYNLFFIKGRALLQELAKYNSTGNFDRVRALGMVMLYREQFMIQYEGNIQPGVSKDRSDDDTYLGNDDFFKNNYDKRLTNYGF